MKKIAIILVSILALSMMMTIAPALAARTPKNDQVFVKVVDSSGKAIGKAEVQIYQQSTGAQSNVISTKGNGLAVISLIKDTLYGGWQMAPYVTIWVSVPGVGVYSYSNYNFYGTFSLNEEVIFPYL